MSIAETIQHELERKQTVISKKQQNHLKQYQQAVKNGHIKKSGYGLAPIDLQFNQFKPN